MSKNYNSGAIVQVAVNPWMKQRLQSLAEEAGMSLSEACRTMFAACLEGFTGEELREFAGEIEEE